MPNRRTKIVATLRPTSNSPEVIEDPVLTAGVGLIDSGANRSDGSPLCAELPEKLRPVGGGRQHVADCGRGCPRSGSSTKDPFQGLFLLGEDDMVGSP